MEPTPTLNTPGKKPTLDRSILVDLLAHATSAAHLVGHLDEPAASQLADHVDAIVHKLTELLGNPQLRGAPNAVEPGRRDGALMLTSGVGGIP